MTGFRWTMWAFGLLFIATMYNAVSAYDAMDSINLQDRFEQIGLLSNGGEQFAMSAVASN